MGIASLSIRKDYWNDFRITDQDLEFLYNYLLEVEQPLTARELVKALISERIRLEKTHLEKQRASGGSVYYPKDHFTTGQVLQFPGFEWQSGTVVNIRQGNNPELPPFDVITVEMENGDSRYLASGLEQHELNQPIAVNSNDPLLDENIVLRDFGDSIETILTETLSMNDHLVRIAGKWFPRALLVDINIGHLNLAEAVLDMMGGGPLDTHTLMDQIDLPSDADTNLNEFSLNLAMQEDVRFDEVGPSGETLWYLHRLEPEPVRDTPIFLKYQPLPNYDPNSVAHYLSQMDSLVIDELEPTLNPYRSGDVSEVSVCLIYPHWRVGTLPLAGNLAKVFPTAIESPRIQFTLVDANSGEKFSGWVVRPLKYIFGLREWYLSQGLIPGSVIKIQRSENPGEILIRADKKRPTREWVRTAITGSDGGILFSMLKHNISSTIDDRMGIVVPNVDLVDELWERNKTRGPLAIIVRSMMHELARLSPQSHVHAQELYAGVNIVRRCPPGPILATLIDSPWAKHLGNLYFRLDDTSGGGDQT